MKRLIAGLAVGVLVALAPSAALADDLACTIFGTEGDDIWTVVERGDVVLIPSDRGDTWRVGFASGSTRSRRPGCGPCVEASRSAYQRTWRSGLILSFPAEKRQVVTG